ncbi:hypothetical protein FHG87_003638 [Trinorchestia longiramus]|nr:hypothetical protein FHG87_003638 [Trinorchestia longiramus]
MNTSRAPAIFQRRQRSLSQSQSSNTPTCPPAREGGRGIGGAGLTARSFLPTPVNTRPLPNHVAGPLSRRTNAITLPQNTTQHTNNHSTHNHNTRPTQNHTKNTIFRVQLRKINPNTPTEKQKIFKYSHWEIQLVRNSPTCPAGSHT